MQLSLGKEGAADVLAASEGGVLDAACLSEVASLSGVASLPGVASGAISFSASAED